MARTFATCGCHAKLGGALAIIEHCVQTGHSVQVRGSIWSQDGRLPVLQRELEMLLSTPASFHASCGDGFTTNVPAKAIEHTRKLAHPVDYFCRLERASLTATSSYEGSLSSEGKKIHLSPAVCTAAEEVCKKEV